MLRLMRLQQLRITSEGQLLDEKVMKIENVTAWHRGMIVLDDVRCGMRRRQ